MAVYVATKASNPGCHSTIIISYRTVMELHDVCAQYNITKEASLYAKVTLKTGEK